MNLKEAFDKYDDSVKMKRPHHYNNYPISWLKGLYAWSNPALRKNGFIILDSMIENANADDWKIVPEEIK